MGFAVKKMNLFFHLCIYSLIGSAQDSSGLLKSSSIDESFYILLSPLNSNLVVLIDDCGREIHSWNIEGLPGMSVKLDARGNLITSEKVEGPFPLIPGYGGKLARYNQEGDQVWAFNYVSATYSLHHDIYPLRNGNILCMAWVMHSSDEASKAGRDTSLTGNIPIWSEKIIEFKPIGQDGATIVWEWDTWDHLIQEFDSTKSNYGEVNLHPERINFNYATDASRFHQDWLHINSISYNEELDQIILSVKSFNEIWIIDHSTTIEEARGNEGGRYGKGGDLLFRWGNPEAYLRESPKNQKLYAQHDPSWLPGGDILVFNNGNSDIRPFSTIDIISPSRDKNGIYEKNSIGAFLPHSFSHSMGKDSSFFSPILSGAQKVNEGIFFVTLGIPGKLFLIDIEGNILWEYQNPISFDGPLEEGSPLQGLQLFKSRLYLKQKLESWGYKLSPKLPLVRNELTDECSEAVVTVIEALNTDKRLQIWPNPAKSQLFIDNLSGVHTKKQIRLYNIHGEIELKTSTRNPSIQLNLQFLEPGLYFLQVDGISKVFIKE